MKMIPNQQMWKGHGMSISCVVSIANSINCKNHSISIKKAIQPKFLLKGHSTSTNKAKIQTEWPKRALHHAVHLTTGCPRPPGKNRLSHCQPLEVDLDSTT